MGTELTTRVGDFLITPQDALRQINEVQAVFKEVMKLDEHYGVIPGTKKPSLLQPGAQLLANMYQYRDEDIIFVDKTEEWKTPVTDSSFPLFAYTVKVVFRDREGRIIATGIGECNSYESRYRWRDESLKCPVCGQTTIIKGKDEYGGGWICFKKKGGCGQKYKDGDPTIEKQPRGKKPNDAIFDQVNTLIKMAKKRAYVNGIIGATRTAGIFTQDMEDFATIQDVTPISVETVDTKTGEIKPAPAKAAPPADALTFGLFKGKSLDQLTENQLRSLVKSMDANGTVLDHPDVFKKAKALLADVFGGALDSDSVRDEVIPPENDVPQDEDDEQAIQVRLGEVRELLVGIVPALAKKGAKLTDKQRKELASACKDCFGVETWDGVKKLRLKVLEAGIRKLVKQQADKSLNS